MFRAAGNQNGCQCKILLMGMQELRMNNNDDDNNNNNIHVGI